MLNFIFSLTPLDSAVFIGWCLLFLLAIPLIIKAKNKFFTVLMCLFMVFTAIKTLELAFSDYISTWLASLPSGQIILQVTLFVIAVFDTVIALLLLFTKPKFKKAVFIPFVVSNVFITLAYNIKPLTDLFVTNIYNLFDTVSSYAVYAKVGVTLIFFILLLIYKYVKKEQAKEKTAATVAKNNAKQQSVDETKNNLLAQKAEATQNTSPASVQPPLIVKNESVHKMFCKSCGYLEETENSICPHCFNGLTTLKECPHCRNMTNGNYCGRCGTKVNS